MIDINSFITPIGGFVGILISITTLVVTIQKLQESKVLRKKELHSLYLEIKALAEDMDVNYAEILILMRRVTAAEFTPSEIQWLIDEPGAFLKIGQYGEAMGKYGKINVEKGEFALSEQISTFNKQLFERLKIVSAGLAIAIGITLMWGQIIIYSAKIALAMYFAGTLLLLNLAVLAMGCCLFWISIDKAVKLQWKPLKERRY